MVSLPAINRKTIEKLIFGIILGTFLLIFWTIGPRFITSLSGERGLLVRFYDVGQGDAILIEKGTTQILIDGGPNDQILTYLGRDLLPWDREIELLVLTHPHADHLSGLIPVIERYKVGRILYYPSFYDTVGYEKFQKLVQEEGAEILSAQVGGRIGLDELSLQLIWPVDNFRDGNVNNESIVMLLDYQDFEALLLGDVEKDVQNRLGVTIDVDLIKVGHHGSVNGSYEPLLRRVRPELAVIFAGAKNRYGHPHQQTLNLFAKLGITLLRTDLNGTVTVRSDGRNFWYDAER
ncbi:MAG: internalization-like protein competence protein ComEC/Rec2, competence protein ComEC protein [candidate division WWE3 bacterium CSP1-7]|uniref:Internalization-like protein competence protein ComEC/Rec2, competence protein ComEC protein n=1 Tax=candidate division WWE3 bacterium CSP1-7 TaxID=1576480 RepID=A0A0T5ZWZ0_UNCKA|nr:MAG: internalization-like protein competence protein ComEC/Rec2, competence protein ComEC protein [candidate division WWE3 bacterium CSP1-7]